MVDCAVETRRSICLESSSSEMMQPFSLVPFLPKEFSPNGVSASLHYDRNFMSRMVPYLVSCRVDGAKNGIDFFFTIECPRLTVSQTAGLNEGASCA